MHAHQVSLGFGEKAIIENISVGFPRGTITALIGPSGSGKTTFLRSLNRINNKVRDFWHHGQISLYDDEIYSPAIDPFVLRWRVGMVFQRPNPFPMSILDNIVSGVKAHRMAKHSDLRDIAETRLAEVGLWSHVADRLPRLAVPPLRWSAADALPRPRPGCRPGGVAARRADVFARPRGQPRPSKSWCTASRRT